MFLDGMSFLIVGAYLSAVVYQGNSKQLVGELKTDIPFVEFAVALGLLGLMYRSTTLHPVGRMLIFAAFLLIGLKVVRSQSSLVGAIGNVAKGADPLAELKALAAPSAAGGYPQAAPWTANLTIAPLSYGGTAGNPGQTVGGAIISK
jgi:hypothetical protein